MRTVRAMAKSGGTQLVHGRNLFEEKKNSDSSSGQYGKKSTYAHSFWNVFFEDCCQKPIDHIRLFPVNKPFQTIYDMYFVPWFKKLIHNENPDIAEDELEWCPSFSTFKKERRHPNFRDVKNRPKHYHARCAECAELNHVRLRGFVNDLFLLKQNAKNLYTKKQKDTV